MSFAIARTLPNTVAAPTTTIAPKIRRLVEACCQVTNRRTETIGAGPTGWSLRTVGRGGYAGVFDFA